MTTGFQPFADCPVCGGVGEVFEKADLAQLIEDSPAQGKLALVNGVVGRKNDPAKTESGVLTCTYRVSDYQMADGDRLVLATRDEWAGENYIRDRGARGLDTDLLRYWPVLEIQRIIGPESASPVPASDYRISDDFRGVTFSGGITAGQQYLIRYRFRPQWVVMPESHSRQIEADNGDRFPNTCLLRMWQGLDLDARQDDLFRGQ